MRLTQSVDCTILRHYLRKILQYIIYRLGDITPLVSGVKSCSIYITDVRSYEVLSHSNSLNRYPLSTFVRPIHRIKSLGRPKLFVLH